MVKNSDKTITIEELKVLARKFRDDRNWSRHHEPKNLAISISIEAAELLEKFQWEDYNPDDHEEIKNELADIVIYCIYFADKLGIDISNAVTKKLEYISNKYPAEFFKNQANSASVQKSIKRSYRQKDREK